MTINATITLARDAYQLAMIELLKAGTLPAALPTRPAWLASLSAAGAPALVLDAVPVNAPGDLSNFYFDDAVYPARSGTYAFIGLLYNGTGGAWARVYLLAGGNVVVNEGGFSLSGAGTIFVHEPASPTEWAWQLLQGDWGAGGPTILLQDLDGGLQATKPTPLEVVDWYDPVEDANAAVTTYGAVYVVTDGVVGQDAIFGLRTFKCVAVPAVWIETSNAAPTTGQVVAALGFTPANNTDVLKKSGAQSASGQLELTGQALAGNNSALTSESLAQIFSGYYQFTKNPADYSAYPVSAGSAGAGVGLMTLNLPNTAGASILINSDASDYRSWQRGGGAKGVVVWSHRTIFHIKFAGDKVFGVDTVFRALLGMPNAYSTAGDFLATHKGIGVKVVNGLIHVQAANGAGVTTISTGVTMSATAFYEYDVTVESFGNGAWRAIVNGAVIAHAGFAAGAPTLNGNGSSRSLVLSLAHTTAGDTKRFSINDLKVLQLAF